VPRPSQKRVGWGAASSLIRSSPGKADLRRSQRPRSSRAAEPGREPFTLDGHIQAKTLKNGADSGQESRIGPCRVFRREASADVFLNLILCEHL
jgi:hypothetical protein